MGGAAVGDPGTLATGREQSWMPLAIGAIGALFGGVYGPQTASTYIGPTFTSYTVLRPDLKSTLSSCPALRKQPGKLT